MSLLAWILGTSVDITTLSETASLHGNTSMASYPTILNFFFFQEYQDWGEIHVRVLNYQILF